MTQQPIQDPDPLFNCDLMDGRDAFLTMARDKHYEFSSLRRAQFSTLSMLYELHNQGQDKFVYTCNNCKNHVETRYHCTVCDVSLKFSSFFNFSYKFLLFSSGFRSLSSLQRESWPRAQNGTIRFRSRRRLIAIRSRSQPIKPSRSPPTVNSTVHSVSGARVSMSRRQLSTSILSEDETRRDPHEELQAENSRWLSHLQAAHRPLLLSCEALQGKQMSRAVLSQHQAEAAAAEPGSTVNSS